MVAAGQLGTLRRELQRGLDLNWLLLCLTGFGKTFEQEGLKETLTKGPGFSLGISLVV